MKDIVCGMEVPNDSQYHHQYGAKLFLFCSEHCLHKFIETPEQYLNKEASASENMSDGATIYTCPMHPEIRQPNPGSCPKCGMALESAEAPRPAIKTDYVCPMHPEVIQDHPGNCPKCGMALEPRTIADGRRKPRTRQHDTAFLGQHDTGWTGISACHDGRSFSISAAGRSFFALRSMDRVRIGNACGSMGRMAILRARLAVGKNLEPKYVYPDRPRCVCSLGLQRGGAFISTNLSAYHANERWHGGRLFRGGSSNHGACAPGPGTGTARQITHQRRHPDVAWVGAQDRAHRPR